MVEDLLFCRNCCCPISNLCQVSTHGIEMLINVVENEVFLSEAEVRQCMWASMANWKGVPGKNIERGTWKEHRN